MAAEYDTVLVEVAGSILGPLAAVAGGERFLSLFEQVLTKLLAKLVGALNYHYPRSMILYVIIIIIVPS